MNITNVSSQAAPQVQPKPVETSKGDDRVQAQAAEPPKAAAKDTVQVSSAAQKMLQEATETAAQTAAEAAKGDGQAKRLLAKEGAQKEAAEPHDGKGGNVDVTA